MQKIDLKGKTVLVTGAAGFIGANLVIELLKTIEDIKIVGNAVLGMIEVSLFIKCYGSEINGLIQTGNQVLNYVVLIESGLSAAFLYKMYKPIADDDNKLLSEYYVGFRNSMGRVVNIMLCVAVASSAIYPFFIRKSTIPYLRMLTIFILLSLKVILPYRITIVPKYMIIAKEQKYKAEFISGITRGLTYISEIFVLCAIIFFSCRIPVEMVLLTGVIISLLDGMIFHFVMRKLYGSILDTNAEPNLTPNKMSKDILVHNLSRMVFSSTDNIIISTMGTLEAVTIYSSYNMVVGQVIELSQKFRLDQDFSTQCANIISEYILFQSKINALVIG